MLSRGLRAETSALAGTPAKPSMALATDRDPVTAERQGWRSPQLGNREKVSPLSLMFFQNRIKLGPEPPSVVASFGVRATPVRCLYPHPTTP